MGDMIRAEVRARVASLREPHVFGEAAGRSFRAEHGEEVLAVRLCDRALTNCSRPTRLVLIEGVAGDGRR